MFIYYLLLFMFIYYETLNIKNTLWQHYLYQLPLSICSHLKHSNFFTDELKTKKNIKTVSVSVLSDIFVLKKSFS